MFRKSVSYDPSRNAFLAFATWQNGPIAYEWGALHKKAWRARLALSKVKPVVIKKRRVFYRLRWPASDDKVA